MSLSKSLWEVVAGDKVLPIELQEWDYALAQQSIAPLMGEADIHYSCSPRTFCENECASHADVLDIPCREMVSDSFIFIKALSQVMMWCRSSLCSHLSDHVQTRDKSPEVEPKPADDATIQPAMQGMLDKLGLLCALQKIPYGLMMLAHRVKGLINVLKRMDIIDLPSMLTALQ